MRAHYLQHVPFEGLGSIETWLKHRGYEITCTRLFDTEPLPSIGTIDLLIIMGGPMSVNDEQIYPWLAQEKTFIQHAIQAGKPVLGICLGAQLIASAMDAKVFPNPVKEIGWFPIRSVNSNDKTAFSFPEELDVFHWHGETFGLPAGAVRIAENQGCENQAFQLGRHVIGLQFHLETTPDSARAIVENCDDELIDGEYIQAAAAILSATPAQYESINQWMVKVLDYLHIEH